MSNAASTIPRMGKKRKIIRRRPRTPREQFAARLRELAGERTTVELGEAWGVTPGAAGHYLSGRRTPGFDLLPIIAKSFGLDDWNDLLPPVG